MITSRLIELLKQLDALFGRPAAAALAGPRRRLPRAPTDALVLRLWGLGNLVLMAPLLSPPSGHRRRLLTLERNAAFVRRHLPVLGLLTLPDPCSPRFPLALARVLARLRRDPPQVIVEAETFLTLPGLLVRAASGAPLVGLDTPGQGRTPLLDRPVGYDPTRHVARTYAALFAAAGLQAARAPGREATGPCTALRATPLDGRLATRLGLSPRRPLVLLHPGSGDHFPGRRWSPVRFGALARALADDGAQVAITGQRREARLAATVVAASGGRARSLAGRVPSEELAALIAAADLLVSNDTGPLHLADALDVPVVGLFGPNTPHRYGPRRVGSISLFADLPCSPCLDDRLAKRSSCRHPLCMEALGVEAVLSACRKVLTSNLHPAREPILAVPG